MITPELSGAERRPADERSELLHGVRGIAGFLGLTVRQVERHIAQSDLPVFRLGRTVCARRSSLDRWLAECEHQTCRRPAVYGSARHPIVGKRPARR